MRGSIKYQSYQLWKMIDGINTSKKIAREKSNFLGMNAHKKSESLHAFLSKKSFLNVAKQLGMFAKNNFGISDMQMINNDIVNEWIDSKIDKGLARDSLSNYISHIQNLLIALEKMPKKIARHGVFFTQEDLIDIRFRMSIKTNSRIHTNRAYVNPQQFSSDMLYEYYIAFQLQLNYGIRAAEAIKILPKQLKKNYTLCIQGKGGYLRDLQLPKKLYNEIEFVLKKDKKYEISYAKYLRKLKKTVLKHGKKWTGTHGLRYSYAQRKYREYLPIYGRNKALNMVSFELGHHRKEIVEHTYLG